MADEDIVIRAILEDETSDPAERVQRALDELGRSNREAAQDTQGLTDAQGRNTDAQERNRRETDRNTDSRSKNNQKTKENTENTDRNTDSQKRNSKERDRSTKSAKSSSKVFGKLSKLLMPLGKAAVMLDALAMAGPAVGALGAAGVAAGAGLSVLSGAAIALPSLLMGAGQAMGVMKMATSGMGEAVSALMSGDYAKFSEATKDMHPNAIATASALGTLGTQFKNIKRDVQGAVFDGLSGKLATLGGKVLPMLRGSFMGTAAGINTGIKTLVDFLNTSKGLSQVQNALRGTSSISQDFAKSMGHAGVGMVGMLSATMPIAQQMSAQLRDGITSLSATIQNNQSKITAFAQRGYDLFRRLMGVLVDLGKGIFNIGRQSMGLAGFMGKGIEDAAAKFKAFTQSVEGKNKIAEFFNNAKPVLSAFSNLIKQVAIAFGGLMNGANNQNLVNVINKLAEAVPTLAALAQQASGGFIENLLQIASAIASIVENMNALGPAGILMSAVAEPTEILANLFDKLPGPIQQAVGYMVMFGLAAKSAAGTAAGAWLLNITGLTAWGNYLKMVVTSNIAALKRYVVATYAAARAGGASKAGAAWAVLTGGIKKATAAVRAFGIAQKLAFLTSPIGLIIIAIIAVIAVFVLLWKKCEGFRNLVKSIGAWFVSVWNGTLYPMIMKVWDWMKSVWDKVYAFIKGVVMGIVNWFRSNWDTIKAVATTVFNVIKTVAMVVFTVLKTYVMTYFTIVKFVFNVIKTVVVAVFNFLKPVVMAFFTGISVAVKVFAAIFKAVWFVIKAVAVVVFSALRIAFYLFVAAFKIGLLIVKTIFIAVFNALKFVFMLWVAGFKLAINIIKVVWTFVWNAIKTVFTTIWNAIMVVVRLLTPVVMSVLNFVRNIFVTVWNAIRAVVAVVIGVIMGIIRTIIGVVSSVMGTVRGIWDSVWNTLTGVVSSVIGTIRGVIDTIVGVVQRVTNTVRSAFTSAFGAIRDFVMPIINTIKSVIDGIKNAASGLADTVGNLASKIPGLATGGIPVMGQPTMVGELGPEAFVSHTGKVSMIGTKGPEVRQFHTPGYVVPNHVLRGGQNDGTVPRDVMSKLQAAASAGAGTGDPGRVYERGPRSNLSSNSYMQEQPGGGDHYDFRGANFGGSNPGDIKSAVKSAIAEADRNKRQRGA